MCPRDALLLAITAGTRVAGVGGQALADWTAYFLGNVEPGLAALLRAAHAFGISRS